MKHIVLAIGKQIHCFSVVTFFGNIRNKTLLRSDNSCNLVFVC